MDSSSGSDTYDRTRGNRSRGRDAFRRPRRDVSRGASGSAIEATGISEKISTLASTLQDTSRNLNKVDRMLGQYREHTDDQAEAMALLKENLEESIGQLQAQRQRRSNGVRSASASTLHTSDLEAGSGSEGQRFYPTSPLKDYTAPAGRRRRSHSASVRFKDANLTAEDVHTLHQSLRDLRSDQQRLSDELDREILLRNRSDVDTRRAMENLTEHLTVSQTQDSVSSRVDRRLEELERELQGERQNRTKGPDQRVGPSDELLQQALGRHKDQAHGRDDAVTARLQASEREKDEMELELQRARMRLEQSEQGRHSLQQQLEGVRGELLRTGKEKTDLQREVSHLSSAPHHRRPDREENGAGPGSARSDLEREVAELRAQVCKASALSEVEELRKTLDLKERERLKLGAQVEELTTDLARREQQQLRMLEQLREIQSRGQAERRETEALLQESKRSREELRGRAQEAVHQWRAKCKRLQKELEEARAGLQLHVDKAAQEKEGSQAQLKALSLQGEAVRRELADVLGRSAQREEELRRKDVELSDARRRHLSLEQENREVREASAALQEEARRHLLLQGRLQEESQRLEEQLEAQARRSQREQAAQDELRASLKEAASARAQSAQRLAEEERARAELQRGAAELQARLTAAQEERASLGQQLQLEREVHQKELHSLRAVAAGGGSGRDCHAQETLRLCRQERDEMQAHLEEVKAEAASEKDRRRALHLKLDRMKAECDKLAAALTAKDQAESLLHRKYQLLRQELDNSARSGDERRRGSEAELVALGEKVSRLEAEREAVLSSVGEELDTVCQSLTRDAEDKLQAISQKPGLVKDPHRWLAETKTKLRWLCEEVREREVRERRGRKLQLQAKEQLRALRRSRDSDQHALLRRLDQQERLLHNLSAEKKELLERSRRKEDEMRNLQDRVLDLETSTRVALDHLETSMPEKVSLAENFRDLEESQRQRDVLEQRYAKCKEIVWELQHQLDESKRAIQVYRDERLDATSRGLTLAALASSVKGHTSTFLSSSLASDITSPHKGHASPERDISPINGAKNVRDAHLK